MVLQAADHTKNFCVWHLLTRKLCLEIFFCCWLISRWMPKWRVRVLLPAVSLCMTMVPWNGSLKSITHFTLLITIITRQVVKRIHMVFGGGIFWLGCWVKILGFKMVLARRLLGGGVEVGSWEGEWNAYCIHLFKLPIHQSILNLFWSV